MLSVVVSAKIPKKLKEEIDRLGINISEVIRRALYEEVKIRKMKKIKELRARLKNKLDKISDEHIVENIRKTREDS